MLIAWLPLAARADTFCFVVVVFFLAAPAIFVFVFLSGDMYNALGLDLFMC